MLVPEEIIFSPITTKRCTKQKSLSWSKSNLKNESVKCEKSEKTIVWSLDFALKIKDSLFQNLHAHALGSKFDSGY